MRKRIVTAIVLVSLTFGAFALAGGNKYVRTFGEGVHATTNGGGDYDGGG